MNLLRESLSNLPGTLSNFVVDNQVLNLNNTNNSVTASSSGEDGSEKSQAIPNALIKEEWQLILGQEASIAELKSAIERCKALVLESDECTMERKWLVRHLVELRFRLKELEDSIEDPSIIETLPVKVILGHHFVTRSVRSLPTVRTYCDHCTGIIWSVVQSSYSCTDCGYITHTKCIDKIFRVCAHVIVSDRKYSIQDICPEIGLAAQCYKCAECQTPLNFKGSWVEPRLCDYTGLFYCPSCHWNDTSVVPARVIHNWDFTTRKVSRASLQEINLFLDKAVVNLEEINPKLFVFLQKLNAIKKRRENLVFMRKYLSECRIAVEIKLLDNETGSRRHLIQYSNFFSISDLLEAESGMLIDYLNKIFDKFENHIRNCDICYGKGYICEICTNDEVIFPFDDGCIYCNKCNSIYHRVCWTRYNSVCKKCTRLEERKQMENVQTLAKI